MPEEALHMLIFPRAQLLACWVHKPARLSSERWSSTTRSGSSDRLPQVQLLLVAGPIPRANGRNQQLVDFIREQAPMHGAVWQAGNPLPKLATTARPEGIPVFVCPYEPAINGLY